MKRHCPQQARDVNVAVTAGTVAEEMVGFADETRESSMGRVADFVEERQNTNK